MSFALLEITSSWVQVSKAALAVLQHDKQLALRDLPNPQERPLRFGLFWQRRSTGNWSADFEADIMFSHTFHNLSCEMREDLDTKEHEQFNC